MGIGTETAVYKTLPRQTSWCEHSFCKTHLLLVYTQCGTRLSHTPIVWETWEQIVITTGSFLWTSWTNTEDFCLFGTNTFVTTYSLFSELQLSELTPSEQLTGHGNRVLIACSMKAFNLTVDICNITMQLTSVTSPWTPGLHFLIWLWSYIQCY